MYYDEQIERKLPVFFILTNTKTQVGYEQIFSYIKEILGFGKNLFLNFRL